jgi:hypothetical protein
MEDTEKISDTTVVALARRLALTGIASLIAFFGVAGQAQTLDRTALENDIRARLAELKDSEQQFLAPSDKDRSNYADFLAQPDTGLIRLLPRESFDNKLSILGDGAYYSFARLTHEYGYGSDIELQQGQFSVGFAGADFGFLTTLGKLAIEDATLSNPAAQFLVTFAAPTSEAEARQQQQRSAAGFEINGFTYRSRVAVKKKRTYLLRSISYGSSDLLIAFRVVSIDDDGSVVIAWKILKKFSVPQLITAVASSRRS